MPFKECFLQGNSSLALRSSSTSVYVQLSSDFGMITTKNLLKVMYMKIILNFQNTIVCEVKRKKFDFKITREVIRRAQPKADSNNPVCKLVFKKSTSVVYVLKMEGCL